MATITKTEYHPNIGSVWARVIALWQGYVIDATLTWSTSLTVTSLIFYVQVTITGETDTYVYNLGDLGAEGGSLQPVAAVTGSSGWMSTPKVMRYSYDERETETDFATNIVPLKQSILSYVSAASCASPSDYNIDYSILSGNQKVWYWAAAVDTMMVIDWISLVQANETDDETFWQSEPPSNAGPDAHLMIVTAGGGGGSVDLTETNAILRDIALADADYTINNGGAIFTLRCKVRTD